MKAFIHRRFAAALVLLSGSVILAQQGSSSGNMAGPRKAAPPAQTTVLQFTIPAAGETCPVWLRAQHKADGSLIQTGAAHPKGLGQWLHLTLTQPQGKNVVSALITLHGFSDKPRVTQASGTGGDASRTMTVPFPATGPSGEADLWVPEMTAVQTIDIDSVTFDDGTVSSLAGNAACRIAPDGFMPIASK